MDYESISVENMAPACGGIIEGINLANGITNHQFDEIYRALLERTVIILRGQNISEEQHISFSQRFGEIQPSAVSGFEKHDDFPEIDILEYDADNPPHVTSELWHTDFVGREKPSMGTTLYARNIPPEGGDTIWVSGISAYEGLSDRMKTYVDDLWAYNDAYKNYNAQIRPELVKEEYQNYVQKHERMEYAPALHPVVRTHPETGKKGLFVNESMTTFVKGLNRRESDYLLKYLFDHLRTPEFQYRHKWQTNDLAIWDNRVSLHYAQFDYTENRLMHRIVIKGDAPY